MKPLIAPESLAEILDSDDLGVFDVRWTLAEPDAGRVDFLDGHIPGARYVALDTDLADPPGRGRHPLPDIRRFADTVGTLGIGSDTDVVVYDDAGGAVAARMWWMLRAIGHNRVVVMDGGWRIWRELGLPIETGAERTVADRGQHPVPNAWPGTVDRSQVEAAAMTDNRSIIDARVGERFRGEVEPIDLRAGHIPGAINLPYTGNLGPDGRHLDARALARRFEALSEQPIVYCGSGVNACHDLLAMAIGGKLDGKLYPGSWSEWAATPELPLETKP